MNKSCKSYRHIKLCHHSSFCLLFWHISSTLLSPCDSTSSSCNCNLAYHSRLPGDVLSQKLLFKTQMVQLLIFPKQTLKCHPYQLQTEVTILQKSSLSLSLETYFVRCASSGTSLTKKNLSFIPKSFGSRKQALPVNHS